MLLWTVQPYRVYEEIQKDGVYRCDASQSELIREFGFRNAYQWMANQMRKRIGPPPPGVEFPVWAWHTWEWKHQRPDLRKREFRSSERPYVLLEAEIPDQDVLLSDEESWHFVLNNLYYPSAGNAEESERKWQAFDALPAGQQKKVKELSWEGIFQVSQPVNTEWERSGCYIQATFWKLRKEQVVRVWRYVK